MQIQPKMMTRELNLQVISENVLKSHIKRLHNFCKCGDLVYSQIHIHDMLTYLVATELVCERFVAVSDWLLLDREHFVAVFA